MAAKIKFQIKALNIGPHRSLDKSFDTESLRLGVYANNGSGKTFLSRVFRLLSNNNLTPKDSNKLLSINQSQGLFEFSVRDTADNKNTLVSLVNIELKRNQVPIVKNDYKYIFHVFNNDYIKENLEELRYKPSGQIEGYILGKEKIDLSKEKAELEVSKLELNKKDNLIIQSIKEAKKQLEILGIRSNTREFSLISYDSLVDNHDASDELESLDNLKLRLVALKSIPDNLENLENPLPSIKDISLLDIEEYLATEFSRSSLAEDFKAKIRTKQLFIEKGLQLIESTTTTCPFCEQTLLDKSLSLIDDYNTYMNDAEAIQSKRADGLIKYLESLENEINKFCNDFLKLKDKYKQYRLYFPSVLDDLQEVEFTPEVSSNILALKVLLNFKKENVSTTYDFNYFEDNIDKLLESIVEYIKLNNINKSIIDIINNKKDNIQIEKLELNRRLIRAYHRRLTSELNSTIVDIIKLRSDIDNLSKDIDQKEQNEKVDRKTKVINSFKLYLEKFFHNKYLFDEDAFCIKFQNNILSDNASDVLSEGKKSIVAFCFYLASVHKIINEEKEYENLFLIIDDPISSLDFHYVYAVAQIFRNMSSILSINRVRFLLLTHNLEFMSIIVRNKIINHRYILTPGYLEILRREMVMPYEEHLRDVYEITLGSKQPSHTTPNSIRHILETINRFIAPDLELQSFCQSIGTLNECEFLYALIQDNSHGGMRLQRAYTDDSIKNGCMTVIRYIKATANGQLTNIISA